MHDLVQYIKDKYSTEIIYEGGGNALFVLDQELSEEWIVNLQIKFKELLGYSNEEFDLPPHLYIKTSDKANELFNNGDFKNARSTLIKSLASKKRDVFNLVDIIHLPPVNTDLCVSCYLRKVTLNPNENEKLCTYCQRLRNEGREIINQEISQILPDKKTYLEYQMEYLAGTPSSELDKETSDEKYRVAVIQIDGNLFGYQFEKIGKQEELLELSQQIQNLMEEIFEELVQKLQKMGLEEDAERVIMGKIYIGGDDIKIITPARLAIPIAYYYITQFRQKINREGLVLSAGIAIGKSKTPLSSLFEISDAMLSKAKVGYKKGSPGSIDIYLNHTNSSNPAILFERQYREEHFEIEHPTLNVGGELWKKLAKLIDIEDFNPTITPDEFKEQILLPWMEVQSQYLQSFITEGRESTTLYTLYQSERHDVKDYRSAIPFLSIGNSRYELEKALEIAKVRYEL